MTITKTRATVDAFTNQNKPDANYGRSPRLEVDGAANKKYAWVFFPFPETHKDGTIASAELELELRDALAGGPHTFTARRVTGSWKENTITHNKMPTVDLTAGAVAAITGGAAGDRLVFDLTAIMQAAHAAGDSWYGVRIEKDTAGTARFQSGEAKKAKDKPLAIFDVNRAPDAAHSPSPSGDSVVDASKPVLSWLFGDPDKEDSQGQFWVIVATDPTTDADGKLTTGIIYDSGWVVSGKQEIDLNATAFAGIADGQQVYWQPKVRDAAGAEAEWMEPATFRRVTKGVLAIISPVAGGTVEEDDTTITYDLSVRTLKRARYEIWQGEPDKKRSVLLWESGPQDLNVAPGVDVSFTIPDGVLKRMGVDYYVQVKAFDDQPREDNGDDRAFYLAEADFQFVRSAVPAAVTAISVIDEQGPRLQFEWTRAVMPDYFLLRVNGEAAEGLTRIDPADFHVGGGVYRMWFYGATPGVLQTFEIEALVDVAGDLLHSQGNDTVDHSFEIDGVWVVVPDLGLECPVFGNVSFEIGLGEEGAKHNKIASRKSAYISGAVRGYEGSISGQLIEGKHDISLADQVDRWEELKGLRNTETTRLVYHGYNYPIQLSGPLNGPKPTMVDEIMEIGFTMFQDGEWTFEMELV